MLWSSVGGQPATACHHCTCIVSAGVLAAEGSLFVTAGAAVSIQNQGSLGAVAELAGRFAGSWHTTTL